MLGALKQLVLMALMDYCIKIIGKFSGKIFCKAVRDFVIFFHGGKQLRELNNTNIVLFPKVMVLETVA